MGAWAFQEVVNVGIQIVLIVFSGWCFARFRLLSGEAFLGQINVLLLRVAFPTLNIYLLGIKVDLRDAEAWRSLGGYMLWVTLVQFGILLYVWLVRGRTIGDAGLLNLVLTANNTVIVGLPVMEATFPQRGGRLSLLTAFVLFLQVIPFSITAFEVEKWMVEDHRRATAAADAVSEPPSTPGRELSGRWVEEAGCEGGSDDDGGDGDGGDGGANAVRVSEVGLAAAAAEPTMPRAGGGTAAADGVGGGGARARRRESLARSSGGGGSTGSSGSGRGPAHVRSRLGRRRVGSGVVVGAEARGWAPATPLDSPYSSREGSRRPLEAAAAAAAGRRVAAGAPAPVPGPNAAVAGREVTMLPKEATAPRDAACPVSLADGHVAQQTTPTWAPAAQDDAAAVEKATETAAAAAAVAAAAPTPGSAALACLDRAASAPCPNSFTSLDGTGTGTGNDVGWAASGAANALPPAAVGSPAAAPYRQSSFSAVSTSSAAAAAAVAAADTAAAAPLGPSFSFAFRPPPPAAAAADTAAASAAANDSTRPLKQPPPPPSPASNPGLPYTGGAAAASPLAPKSPPCALPNSAAAAAPAAQAAGRSGWRVRGLNRLSPNGRASADHDPAPASAAAATAGSRPVGRLSNSGGLAALRIGIQRRSLPAHWPPAAPAAAAAAVAAGTTTRPPSPPPPPLSSGRLLNPLAVACPDLPVPQAISLARAPISGRPSCNGGYSPCRTAMPYDTVVIGADGDASGRLSGPAGRRQPAPPAVSASLAAAASAAAAAEAEAEAGELAAAPPPDRAAMRAAAGSMTRRNGGLIPAVGRWVRMRMAQYSRAWSITWVILKNPLLWSLLVGLLVNLSGLRSLLWPGSAHYRPELGWLAGSLAWTSGITVPVSLFSNGVWLYGKTFGRETLVQAGWMLLLKLLVLAPLQLACAAALKLEAEAAMSLLLMSLCPVASASFVIASQYGHGADLVTAMTLLGIALLVPVVLAALALPRAIGLYSYTVTTAAAAAAAATS
ncbi:hypothetical protein PLESTM_000005500 [Pleodorina starrii]|nr:hypothetical protein PLESTM_000005500 [Pleodorina starrii]